MIQIYGGCHSVHDISFSLIRHPILYQCLFRFLVVALILQQIYVQDGYPLRPMLISMGIIRIRSIHIQHVYANASAHARIHAHTQCILIATNFDKTKALSSVQVCRNMFNWESGVEGA